MSQTSVDFSGDPTGDELLDDLLAPLQENSLTGHSGTSRPSYAQAGTEWIDTTSNPWIVKRFDGSDDIIVGYINTSTNIYTPAGLILDNLSATTAPTINDDSADGYTVGSKWINTTTDIIYICVDSSVGAAIWATQVTLSGGTFTGKIITAASATGNAGLNIPHGAAPTSPVNGDFWSTTTALFSRINGVTHTLLTLLGGTLTGKLTTLASATGGAGLNLPHGAAPTSPVNGDIWTTTTGTYTQINGVTVRLSSDIPYNHITGCLLSGITGNSTTAAMSVSSGQASDSSNTSLIASAGYSWAASNGNAINGTDAASSTLANSTTYHMFLCSGASGTGTFASASLTPTFPTGYAVSSRRIGSFNTNSSGAPIPYNSIETAGGAVTNWLVTQVLDINISNLSTTRTAYTLTVPSGIKVQPLYRTSTTSGANSVIFTSGDETNVAPAAIVNGAWTAVPGFDEFYDNGSNRYFSWKSDDILTTNTSGQINARASGASTTIYWVTRGFIDWRRS